MDLTKKIIFHRSKNINNLLTPPDEITATNDFQALRLWQTGFTTFSGLYALSKDDENIFDYALVELDNKIYLVKSYDAKTHYQNQNLIINFEYSPELTDVFFTKKGRVDFWTSYKYTKTINQYNTEKNIQLGLVENSTIYRQSLDLYEYGHKPGTTVYERLGVFGTDPIEYEKNSLASGYFERSIPIPLLTFEGITNPQTIESPVAKKYFDQKVASYKGDFYKSFALEYPGDEDFLGVGYVDLVLQTPATTITTRIKSDDFVIDGQSEGGRARYPLKIDTVGDLPNRKVLLQGRNDRILASAPLGNIQQAFYIGNGEKYLFENYKPAVARGVQDLINTSVGLLGAAAFGGIGMATAGPQLIGSIQRYINRFADLGITAMQQNLTPMQSVGSGSANIIDRYWEVDFGIINANIPNHITVSKEVYKTVVSNDSVNKIDFKKVFHENETVEDFLGYQPSQREFVRVSETSRDNLNAELQNLGQSPLYFGYRHLFN